MKIKQRILAAFILIGVFASASALSCSCFRTATDESRFDKATHVFTARVTSAKEVGDSSGPRVEATFAVTEVFKGKPRRLTRIWSYLPFGADSDSCAVAFTVGEHYVFLIGDDGLVQYCSGSKRYNPALEESVAEALRVFARAKKP